MTTIPISTSEPEEFPDVTDPSEPNLPDPTYPFDTTPLEF